MRNMVKYNYKLSGGCPMVKIPSLDELKKAGAGFVNQAKSGDYSGMVDKIKTGIDNMTVNKGPVIPGDTSIAGQFQQINAIIAEIGLAQTSQNAGIRKLESQLDSLARILEAQAAVNTTTTTTSTTTIPTSNEDKKI
jgi:hypothetical protein